MTRAQLLAVVAASLAHESPRYATESKRDYAHRLCVEAVPYVEEGENVDAALTRAMTTATRMTA